MGLALKSLATLSGWLARVRAAGAALARLVAVVLSVALGFGTFVLLIAAAVPCLD